MREKHKYLKLKMMHGKYLNCYSGSEKTRNKIASFEAAKHNKYFYLCLDILNISYQEGLLLSKHSQISLSSVVRRDTQSSPPPFQDVCPLFEVLSNYHMYLFSPAG